MDDTILITELNDFIFCPISIYFHKLYGDKNEMVYQSDYQINGKAAHSAVDDGNYSTSKHILMGLDVYCEQYGLTGKIDIFDTKNKVLRERKKRIKTIYDGYVFQVYAQYFALIEMGYLVDKIQLFSMDDRKTYDVPLPKDDLSMLDKFEQVIKDIRDFKPDHFRQDNCKKCQMCIYEPACDRALSEG